MLLSLKEPHGETHDIYVTKFATVSDLKSALGKTLSADESRLEIIFQGKVLLNERTLESYGVSDGCEVFFVLKPEKIKQQNPIKKKAPEEPESLMDQLQSTLGKAMLDSMNKNPDLLLQMFDSIPQLKELKEKHPDLQHMLTDSEEMSEIMEIHTSKGNKKQSALMLDNMLDQIDNYGLSRVNRLMNEFTEPLMDGIFGEPKMQTYLPTEKLSGPSENPLPMQSGLSMSAPQILASTADLNCSERISLGLSKLREAIHRIEQKGIDFPKKEEVYKTISNHSRKVLMQGKLESIKKLYGFQLSQLKAMGFSNEDDVLEALFMSNGDKKKSISYLMRNIRENGGY